MVAAREKVTFPEFQTFIQRDENSDRLFELINGDIVEVMPGRTRNSELHNLIVVAVHNFCEAHSIACHTSSADGAYRIQEHVVAPDFAYKRTPMSDDYRDPDAPLWVVEIISPTDKAEDVRDKRDIYVQAGILLWEVYPRIPSVDVYVSGQPVRTFTLDDVLDGGDVLPDFRLPMLKLFGSR